MAEKLCESLLKAVHFIHSEKVMHRDLKPENLIVTGDDLKIKICDFGISRMV